MRLCARSSITYLKKCPPCLQEFGWCGILAVVYAAELPMPRSQKQLVLFFENVKVALNISSDVWISSEKEERGCINFDQIVKLLKYYQCDCKVVRFKRRGIFVSLRNWIQHKKKTELASSYIVNVTGHAVFVRFLKGMEMWEIYDQNGVCHQDSGFQLQTACSIRNKILYIVKIL